MRAASLPLPILVSLASFALYGAVADAPGFLFPEVPRYGGVVALPEAAEQPRSGMKLVFDIVSDTKPEEVNKGLESVARYLNLNAQAGHKPSDVKLALVLHGNSTKAAMHDAAFARHTSAAKNPSTELIRELKRRGVELFVCGQSLAAQ